MIKAVIFDVDGVLLDSFLANLKFVQDIMTEAGYRSPTEGEYRPLFHLPLLDVIKVLTRSVSKEEIKRIWEIGKKKWDGGYPVELLGVPEGAEEVIKKLSQEYLLAIVTSRISDGVFKMPQLKILEKYFKTAVTFEDTTNHKPDPEPLFLAAEKLKIKPKEAVYVGDAEVDVLAAKSAGMKMIAYSENNYENADARTVNFSELPGLVHSLT